MISLSDDSLQQLACCELCEHRCRVNRLLGERGVCRVGLPEVASAGLHPAPPQSFTIFTAGCNFKCLFCQNWTISQHPDSTGPIVGWWDPASLAREALRQLNSDVGRAIGADRIFFSGGSQLSTFLMWKRLSRWRESLHPRPKSTLTPTVS